MPPRANHFQGTSNGRDVGSKPGDVINANETTTGKKRPRRDIKASTRDLAPRHPIAYLSIRSDCREEFLSPRAEQEIRLQQREENAKNQRQLKWRRNKTVRQLNHSPGDNQIPRPVLAAQQKITAHNVDCRANDRNRTLNRNRHRILGRDLLPSRGVRGVLNIPGSDIMPDTIRIQPITVIDVGRTVVMLGLMLETNEW